MTAPDVALRPMTEADVRRRDEHRLELDPELLALNGQTPATASWRDAESELLALWAAWAAGTRLDWTIFSPDGLDLGAVSLSSIDRARGWAELEIGIYRKAWWNRGVGRLAIAHALSGLANELGPGARPTLVRALTLPTNARARRCFEACGFALRGPTTDRQFPGVEFLLYERTI